MELSTPNVLRLTANQAHQVVTRLETAGWRAEYLTISSDLALVEVRDLSLRGHPKVATIRTVADAETFLATAGHGMKGRNRCRLPDGSEPPPHLYGEALTRHQRSHTIPTGVLVAGH